MPAKPVHRPVQTGEIDDLASWVCTALMRLGTRMATTFDAHFAEHGLTQAQFRVLLAVWSQGGQEGLAPSALAEHLLIERATVSVLTQRLVERGWLARAPGPNRRTFRLVLTPEGGQLLQRFAPRATAFAQHTLAGMSPADLTALRAHLEQIESRLRTFSSPEGEHA